MALSLIVAVSENGVIGRDGDLPWRLTEDLRRFKRRTVGHTVVMGRKTAESIAKRLGGPLPDRRNVVLTRNPVWFLAGFETVHSWEETIALGEKDEVFIIGGAELYRIALPYVGRLYVTHVHCQCRGDAFFPHIDHTVWKLAERERFDADERHKFGMTFATYDRTRQ